MNSTNESEPIKSRSETNWNWKTSVIVVLIIILVNLFIISSIQAACLILTGWQFDLSGVIIAPGSKVGVWLGTVIGELLILGITLFFAVYLFKGKLNALNFRRPSLKHLLIALGGVVAAYGASILGAILQNFLTGPDPNESSYNLLFQTSNVGELLIWVIIMMCVVGPIEEIFARGFVQQGLQNSCKSKKIYLFIGISIASLLFAVVHLDVYRIIPLFLVGFILGLVYYYTDNNSMASAITHGLYNSVTLLLFFLFP